MTREHVARAAPGVAGVVFLLASLWTAAAPAAGAADPLEAMTALRPPALAPAPAVAFRTLDGRATRAGDLRGQPVLLTFFTTW